MHGHTNIKQIWLYEIRCLQVSRERPNEILCLGLFHVVRIVFIFWVPSIWQIVWALVSKLRLKCDGTRAETRFRLSAKWAGQVKSAWGVGSVDYWQPRCAHQLLWLVVMLDTPCSEVVWRLLATQSIGQFLLHFLSHASPCAITFQLDSSTLKCRRSCIVECLGLRTKVTRN